MTAPRVLPVPTPRPPLVMGPAASFAAGFLPVAVLFAALYAILRKLTQQNEEQT